MRRTYFVCVVLCLATLTLSQSESGRPATQPTKRTLLGSESQRRSQRFPSSGHRRSHGEASGLSFAPAVAYGSGGFESSSVAVADVNRDGKPDLVVANPCTSGSGFGECTNETGVVGVLLGNGDGTFQKVVTYNTGGYFAWSVAVADVNGDGKPDLLVANEVSGCCSYGTVSVLLGNGDGTFQTAVTYPSGGHAATSVAVADVNGDGKPDLVVANLCVSYPNDCANGVVGVLLGNGDGTFQTAVAYGSGAVGADSVAVADVNGDGKLDLLVANPCTSGTGAGNCENQIGMVGVLLGNGDGTFQTALTYGSGGYSQSVAVADVNGDGKPDLLVAATETLGVLLGNGDGTFQPVVSYGSGGLAYSVAVADMNGDGQLDLVVANEQANNVGVLLGNGNGTFQEAVTFGSAGLEEMSVAIADVNGDGRPDVLVANLCATGSCLNGSVGVLLNTSVAPSITTVDVRPSSSDLGQLVVYTGTVQCDAEINGVVSFYMDGGLIDTEEVYGTNGSATANFGVTWLTRVGIHSITAVYSEGEFCSGSTSPPVAEEIDLDWTTTTLTSAPNPSAFGQPVIFTANVYGEDEPDLGYPTGTVSFSDGSTLLGTSSLSGGIATFSTSALAVGLHSINAVYSGDGHYGTSSASLSQTVNTAAYGVVSPTTVNFGLVQVGQTSPQQRITLKNTGNAQLTITSISISGDFALPVNKCANGVKPGTHCNVDVTFTPHAAGTETGTLTFTDNALNSPQTVSLIGTGSNMVATTTTLTSSPNPSTYGEAVTFTAVVNSSEGAPSDGETVSFMKGKTVLGTGTLSSGSASFRTSTLPRGTNKITAVYGGDSNFAGSTSNKVKQVVKP